MHPKGWLMTALLAIIATIPGFRPLAAQMTESGESPAPVVFSFVLRYAGPELLDPLGVSGRREVLQLIAGESAEAGRFRRARVDELENEEWSTEGWYEIRGNTIRLYYQGPDGGASGRVEVGRYHEKTICFHDRKEGVELTFYYLQPIGPIVSRPQPCSPPSR